MNAGKSKPFWFDGADLGKSSDGVIVKRADGAVAANQGNGLRIDGGG